MNIDKIIEKLTAAGKVEEHSTGFSGKFSIGNICSEQQSRNHNQ